MKETCQEKQLHMLSEKSILDLDYMLSELRHNRQTIDNIRETIEELRGKIEKYKARLQSNYNKRKDIIKNLHQHIQQLVENTEKGENYV